jgi:hypothetical protein
VLIYKHARILALRTHTWTHASTYQYHEELILQTSARKVSHTSSLVISTNSQQQQKSFISRIGSDRMIAGAGFIFILFLFTVTVIIRGNFIITCGNVLLNLACRGHDGIRIDPTHGAPECGE